METSAELTNQTTGKWAGGESQFHELDAVDLIEGLRLGKWTSRQLTESFLARIQKEKPRAIVSLEAEKALKQAQAVDQLRSKGERLGLFQGLPVTIKDSFRMAGYLSTWGLWEYRKYRPRSTCALVEAVLQEDAIVMGRTVVPTAAFDFNCRNQIHPECVNPFDSLRTPGGSSGGAAAALAQGYTPLEIGSDIAGSIRYPSHCCGVTGIRTTDGWLPIQDTGPENSPYPFSCLVVPGPMARTLKDLEFFLGVLQTHFPIPVSRQTHSFKAKKLAFSFSAAGVEADDETKSSMQKLVAQAEQSGIQVAEAKPDFDEAEIFRDWCLIVGYEYNKVLPSFLFTKGLRTWGIDFVLFSRLNSFMRKHLLEGLQTGEQTYQRALERRAFAQKKADEFFSRFDLWALPVSASPALLLKECGRSQVGKDGRYDYSYFIGSHFCPTAMMGTPAVSFPIGVGQGLPIGVQVHGPRFSDPQLLSEIRRIWSDVR